MVPRLGRLPVETSTPIACPPGCNEVPVVGRAVDLGLALEAQPPLIVRVLVPDDARAAGVGVDLADALVVLVVLPGVAGQVWEVRPSRMAKAKYCPPALSFVRMEKKRPGREGKSAEECPAQPGFHGGYIVWGDAGREASPKPGAADCGNTGRSTAASSMWACTSMG